MHTETYGLDGIPAGDPGFTVAIEVDQPLSTLSPSRRAALLDTIPVHVAHLDRSPLGNARVVFEIPHSGWLKSGNVAIDEVGCMQDLWPIVGIEICRSDLWLTAPFVDHDADSPPDPCSGAEQRRRATVLIEVEPERTASGKRRTTTPLLTCLQHLPDARLSRSGANRPHVIVETHGSAAHGARRIAKAALTVSDAWSITRIRSVRSDIYRAETFDTSTSFGVQRNPQISDWQFASNSNKDRYVIVTDPDVDLSGWSADITTVDGHTFTRPFILGSVSVDNDGTANIVGRGPQVPAWLARMENSSRLVALHTADTRLAVDPWDSMTGWLVESMHAQPVGLVIELGPRNYGPAEEREGVPVVCAQIQVLEDGVLLMRRSREVLDHLMLADYSATGLELDTWRYDGLFDDCTAGYFFTRDTRLIANSCITWFRDEAGMTTPDDLGCDYRFADELPRFRATTPNR